MKRAVAFALPILGFALVSACAADVRLGDFAETPGATEAGTEDVAPTPDASSLDAVATDDAAVDTGLDAACTIDCKGNPCAFDKCLPLVLATGQAGATYLTIDATDVFWSTVGHAGTALDPNVVAKTSLAPGGAVVALDSAVGTPRGITVDATQIYWLRASGGTATIHRASKLDGSNAAVVGSFPGPDVQALVQDPATLWAVQGTEIRGWFKTDNATAGTQVNGTFSAGEGMAINADRLYLADRGASALKVLHKVTGIIATTVPLPGTPPVDVAVDATHMYFAAGTIVGRVAHLTTTVETIASGLAGAAGIAIDGTTVYFTTKSTVAKAVKGTNAITVLVDGLTQGSRLAVDATYVYFADSGTGVISRIPK